MNLRIANSLGTLGYASVMFQWLWMTIVIATPLLSYEFAAPLFLPPENSTPVEPISADIPGPVAVIIMVLAVVFTITLIIYATIAVPRTIGHSGQKVTKVSAQVVLPHVTHRRKITKKQKKRLLERITWSIKLVLVAIPLVALLLPVSTDLGLERDVVIGFGLFCAAVSMLWFGLQFIYARLTGIPNDRLW